MKPKLNTEAMTKPRVIAIYVLSAFTQFFDDLFGTVMVLGSVAASALILWLAVEPAGALSTLRDLTADQARDVALLAIVLAVFFYFLSFSNAFSKARRSLRRARNDLSVGASGTFVRAGISGEAVARAGEASMDSVPATVHKAATARAEGESEATADASVEKAGDGQQKTE